MKYFECFKRSVDIFLSLLFITVTLPLQFTIVISLILLLRENPFFLQARGLTLDKYRFIMLKFKTMQSAQTKNSFHIHSKDIFLLPNLAVDLNWFTKWLRKSGLDELPQFYNILVGQMSFIGPRPLMIQDLMILEKEFPKQYALRESIESKPGLTGTWQIFGDRSQGVENLIGMDIFYEEEKSFKLDLNIFLLTFPIVLLAKNSDAIIPRRNLISKLFSLSLSEINFIYSKGAANRKPNVDLPSTYSITIPANWWFASDSYAKHQNPTVKPIKDFRKRSYIKGIEIDITEEK